MPMNTLDMVRKFHEAFGLPVADKPYVPRPDSRTKVELFDFSLQAAEWAAQLLSASGADKSGLLMRLHLCMEELGELATALAHGNPVEALDALADMRYVADGAILHLGFGDIFDAAMTEVHASNMSKLVDGKPVLKASGRFAKPDTYFKPYLTALAYAGIENG